MQLVTELGNPFRALTLALAVTNVAIDSWIEVKFNFSTSSWRYDISKKKIDQNFSVPVDYGFLYSNPMIYNLKFNDIIFIE